MSGPTGDVVWVDVLPSLDKFAPLMRTGLAASTGIAGQQGAVAGAAFGKSFGDTAAAALDSAAAKVGAANKRMADATGQLNVALAKLADLMDADNVSASRLAAANEAVAKAQRNVALTTDAASTALKQQAVVTRAVSDAGAVQTKVLTEQTAKTEEHNLATKALSGTMGLATKALTVGFTAALVGLPFIAAIRDAQSFDRQMTLVSSQAGATTQEVRNLTPAVLSLAGKTAQAPEELALSLYHVESTGIRGAAAINVVAAAARFATVSHANLEETTNALTSSVASGIPGFKNMNEAIGILNATVGSGDMKLSDLNQALGSGLLTIVKTYGLTMRDVAAALATFGDNNIRGALAATDLRLAVQALAVPSKQGRGELAALGLTADQLAKDMQTGGLNKAIIDLRDHLEKAGISGSQMGQVLTEVFGKKAGPGLAILVSQFDRLQSKYTEVNRQANEFGNAWDQTTKTAAFAFQSLLDSLKAVGIILGNAVLPILTKVATAVSNFFSGAIAGTGVGGQLVKAFKDLGDAVGQLIVFIKPLAEVVLVTLGAAFKALIPTLETITHWYDQHKTLINSLIILVGTFTGIIYAQVAAEKLWALTTGAVSTAVGLLRGIWLSLNILFVASPIGFVITALLALGAAIYFAYTRSAVFRQIVADVWAWIKNAFLVTIDALVKAWHAFVDALITAWQSTINGLKTAWDSVSGALKAAWDGFWNGMKTAYHAVVDALGTAWHSTVSGLKTAWDAFSSPFVAAWQGFWSGLKAVVVPVWNALNTAWDAVGAAIKAVWDNVLHPVWNVMMDVAKVLAIVVGVLVLGPIALAWKGIQIAIQGAVTGIQAAWQTMVAVWDTVAAALKTAWNATWNAIKDALNAVVTFLNQLWNGLLRALSDAWNAFIAPFKTAWNASWAVVKDAFNAVMQVAQAIWNATMKGLNDAWNAFIAPFKIAWNASWGAIKDAFDAVTKLLSQLWSTLLKAITDVWHVFINLLSNEWNAAWSTIKTVSQAVWDAIKTAWNAFTGAVSQIAEFLWSHITGGFRAMRDAIVGAFNDTINGVKAIWNTIEEIVGTPINFIIQYVFNDGLFKAWNWIVDTLGLPKNWHASNFSQIGSPAHHFADGGFTGQGMFGTGGRLDPAGVVHAGEFVHTQDKTRKFRPLFEAIHSGQLQPRDFGLGGYATGGLVLPGYGDGGQVVPQYPNGYTYTALENWAKANVPGVIITDALRPGANDYHGLGEAIDMSFPGNPQSKLEPLAAKIAASFGAITELIHNPNESIKNGQIVPSSFWGAATWAEHANHVHWAMTPAALGASGSAPKVGGGGGGIAGFFGEVWNTITDVFGDISKAVTTPLAKMAQFGNSSFVQMAEQIPLSLMGKMWDAVKGVVGGALTAAISAASAAAGINDTASLGTANNPSTLAYKQQAFQIAGQQFGWNDSAQQQGLDYIASHESGWNPGARNPTSSASGIWQQLDSTWAAYKNANQLAQRAYQAPSNEQDYAGLRYIHARYGDPIAAETYWKVHHNYDSGGLWPSGTPGWNLTGATERVLTPQQDNYFRDFVDLTSAGQAGGAGALINGGVHIDMAQGDPHEVMDELVYRMRVASRGGVYSTVYGGR